MIGLDISSKRNTIILFDLNGTNTPVYYNNALYTDALSFVHDEQRNAIIGLFKRTNNLYEVVIMTDDTL